MKHFRFLISGLLMLGILFPALSASALEVPPRPQGYVHDPAEVLPPVLKNNLTALLSQFERATTNQIVLAVFPSLENESLEDFSIRLAEAWKVGQRGRDNGVILLIFQEERMIRIEVGYGLEGALTDAEAGMIINQVMVPRFREGAVEAGITEGLAAIIQAVQAEYQGRGSSPYAYDETRELTPEELEALRKQTAVWAAVIGVCFLALFVIDFLRYQGYRRGHSAHHDRYTFWEWFFRFALVLAVLSFIFRMLFYMMLFSRGGAAGRRGGGFSAGGGSFGGGGASGRW